LKLLAKEIGMATGQRLDPYGGYNFRVEWDGIIQAGFKTCAGLDSTQDVVDYREGTEKGLGRRRLPTLLTSANLTLGRGITDNHELWDWRAEIIQGKGTRKNLSVILMDDQGREKRRWNLVNCWPSKWTGPSFDATTNEVAIETLEIAHEGISMA
jgi:phage tail-like protein